MQFHYLYILRLQLHYYIFKKEPKNEVNEVPKIEEVKYKTVDLDEEETRDFTPVEKEPEKTKSKRLYIFQNAYYSFVSWFVFFPLAVDVNFPMSLEII